MTVCVLVFLQVNDVCSCVFVDPDVVSVIIPYASYMTAWAEIARLLGLTDSMVLLRNNSQTVE